MLYLIGSESNKKDLLAYVERHLSSAEAQAASPATSASSASDVRKNAFPALSFLKKLRSLTRGAGGFSSGGSGNQEEESAGGGGGGNAVWGFAQDLFSRFTGGSQTACPVTKIADSLHTSVFNNNSSASTSTPTSSASGGGGFDSSGSGKNKKNEIIFLDPRSRSGDASSAVAAAGVNNIVVFVVGGVSPVEYEDLKRWSQQKQVRCNIIVGGTEVLTGESLLSQLDELGKE